MNPILLLVVVIACPLLWMMIVAPLMAKLFGVPLRVGVLPIAKRDQQLSRRQSFWLGGVLGWGIGLSLLAALIALLLDERRFTVPQILWAIVSCPLITGSAAASLDLTYPVNRE